MTTVDMAEHQESTNANAAAISFIRRLISDSSDKSDAGFSQYALIQVLSTFSNSGLPFQALESVQLSRIVDGIHRVFQEKEGSIGSAPALKADINGVAIGIQALSYASKPVQVDGMVQQYGADNGFRTYPDDEEHYSFSANCQALAALLCHKDVAEYEPQLLKTVQFLCKCWWESDAEIHDNMLDQNSSHLRCSLLFVQAMIKVLALVDQEASIQLTDQDLQSRLLIAVFQACLRAILMQADDGSWNSSVEESAYGVLILCEARRLSMFSPLASPLELAIKRGVAYLQASPVTAPTPTSNGYMTSPSNFNAHLYVVAALYRAATSTSGTIGDRTFDMARATKGRKHVKLFKMTPLFSEIPEWQIQASMIESVLFQPMLYARRLDVFPRKDMEDDGKYFDIIPFTWTCCNNRQRTFVSTSFLYEMMVISFLNYQADEFLESCAGTVPTGTLRQLIDNAFLQGSEATYTSIGSYPDIVAPLKRFITYISTHPSLLAASAWDRGSVMRELRIFLHAHVTQLVDNVQFQQKQQTASIQNGSTEESDPNQETFFQWVRTTSANHTSCPYSFSFVSCLISSGLLNGQECFPTIQEKYIGAALCLHLATMCRMYNDYGSTGRDATEGNLNSVNFPEYDSTPGGVEGKKRALFDVADYERTCLDHALRKLGAASSDTDDTRSRQMQGRKLDIWQMFCDVTDLYGQIYVVRDIGSRITGPVSVSKRKSPTDEPL